MKNMTPELQAQEQANKKRREEQREAERRAKKARMERAREVDARRAYPSPDRSPGRSVDPSLPSEATPSRKRRSSDDDEDSDSDAPRSKKRSRVCFLPVGLCSKISLLYAEPTTMTMLLRAYPPPPLRH